MIDIRKLGFAVQGPFRHSNGSFKFMVVILNPSAIMGGPPDVVGTADIHVDTNAVCLSLAEALRQISDQLPPDLALPQ